jgi:hypothetical protein
MIDPRSILARSAAAFIALVLVGFVSAQGLELTFEKAAVGDTVWTGAVSGDVEGTLTTVLIHADDSQPVWQVDFYWIITADDPARSFIARLDGILDTETGEVALSGSVVDGYRAGARVEEQAVPSAEARRWRALRVPRHDRAVRGRRLRVHAARPQGQVDLGVTGVT